MRAGAIELGGSHVSAAVVELEDARVDGLRRVPLAHDGRRSELIDGILRAAETVRGVGRLGVAAPGPFDYENGVCTISGLGKLESLFGLDLRRELAQVVPGAGIRFLNDAEAFLLGESLAGAARGHDRAVGITLGTGLGSAFLAGGEIVREGRVPPNGELHVVPFRGGFVEDVISGRGIAARYDGSTSSAELAERADGGDAKAAAVFASVGADLAEFLAPWLAEFEPSCVVVGGSIARAWRHFGPSLREGVGLRAVPAARLEDAALLGAALHAWSS